MYKLVRDNPKIFYSNTLPKPELNSQCIKSLIVYAPYEVELPELIEKLLKSLELINKTY